MMREINFIGVLQPEDVADTEEQPTTEEEEMVESEEEIEKVSWLLS